jgi:[amino-group carrier protein]-gamma-(L-lysyl/L-ornithyl)-L-glutamate aminotransferase
MRDAIGLDSESASTLQSRYELDVYGKRGQTLVRGRGAHLWDAEGREYIDCMSGHGAFNLGHSDPRLLEALFAQARELMGASGAFHHRERARLMSRLVELSPGSLSRAFFCNSGTEATEAALKFARVSTGRTSFVAFKRSFHGRTFGAMSASFQPKSHEMFAPVVPGVRFLPFNDTESLEAGLGDDVACVLLELVQGEGGVHVARADFVDALARICSERGILLAVDEVQTGFGRTGALFACEHYRLEPDLLVLAKSIAGGFPMGAVLAGDRIRVPVGAHGSTFGGNPVACAVANRVLDCLIEDELPERARRLGALWLDQLRHRLLPAPLVEEVRGVGLMVGIQLRTKVAPLLEALAEAGTLALAAGPKVLRLLPPLVIDERDLEEVAAEIEAAVARLDRDSIPATV